MYADRDDRIAVRHMPFACAVLTEVWISDKASKEFTKFVKVGDPDGAFSQKLEEAAKRGFGNLKGGFVKSQGNGVYSLWIRLCLFRLYGFFFAGEREFIIINSTLKKGQKRNSRDTDKVNEVAQIKASRNWKKVEAK